MFRFSERLSPSGKTDAKRYVRRAGLFAAGLLLLWTALQLFPSSPAEPPVYSDEAGSVASSEPARSSYQGPQMFTFGNFAAFIILVGGGGFAYYLHKKSTGGSGGTQYIESVGELPIGQGQQLRLVRCGGEVLLIGATAHEITLLRDFDPAVFDGSAVGDGASQNAAGVDGAPRNTAASDGADDDRPSENAQRNAPAPQPDTSSSHFADVLRQYAGRYASTQSNGRTC